MTTKTSASKTLLARKNNPIMTTLLDAPATTRREKTMLNRKVAAPTEPETTTVTELPMVEQAPTIVVTDDTNPEQPKELATDPSADPVTETSEPESAGKPEPVVIAEAVTVHEPDVDDVFTMDKSRPDEFPMLGFTPVRKDASDDDDNEVPYAPSMSAAPYFADDDDESGLENRSMFFIRRSDEEQDEYELEMIEKEAVLAPIREADEKAHKEKETKDAATAQAKAKARIENRAARRMLGIIMLAAGTLSAIYGIIVPYLPGM